MLILNPKSENNKINENNKKIRKECGNK